MKDTVCPIWGTPATLEPSYTGSFPIIMSPRAGGKYTATGTAQTLLSSVPVEQKALITTWLCNQRRAGVDVPRIGSETLEAAKTAASLTVSERIDRALLHFRRYRIDQRLITSRHEQFDNRDTEAMILAAEIEAQTKQELIAFCNLLIEMNLLVDHAGTSPSNLYQFSLTAQGWLRLDELTKKGPNTSQAFVAMWFNESTQAAYTDGIEPAIAECGYRAMRIDKKEHSNKIDDEIIAEIRRSKFLVADFTCEKEKVRGGVYFEAGFAMGLGIPVIWTVEQQSLGDVHFDTRQYNHIVWDTPGSLRSSLKTRIGAILGDGPLVG
ncbi:hypothetical protein ACQR09_01600 [Bradyrhizobium oligotrophicum]|uniref:hypothetical protein n=1 Tax=Bradyrhizobium oligotrophicum TaxID=44255 RepID=UPI003EB95B87